MNTDEELMRRVLRQMDGTTVRIIVKSVLCEEAGISQHIVPEYIELETDKAMRRIYQQE